MEEETFGGNILKGIKLQNKGEHTLCVGPYEYFFYKTNSKEEFIISKLQSFTVFILEKDKDCTISVNNFQHDIDVSDAIQVENTTIKLNIVGGFATLLVAGTKNKSTREVGIHHTKSNSIYKVEKPWGHELWINGEHECYALKQIYIKAGTKTSLQYHNFKQETNVLLSGTAKLHFKKNTVISNDKIKDKDIDTVVLEPITSIDVKPGSLHRIEAVTDILLYETSTPHLDDVIRVLDDAKRPSGRIQQEHKMNEIK
jgi:mannose-6-phosphate isomerase